jgi:hypothetical protein
MCKEAYQGAARCEKKTMHRTYPDTSASSSIAQIKVNGNVAYQTAGSGNFTPFAALFFVFGGLDVALAVVYRTSK